MNPNMDKIAAMEKMELTIHPGANPGQVVFELNGPLTLGAVFSLQAKLREDLSPVTILDLTHVAYIDSAGIGVLVNAYVSRERDSRKLGLVGVCQRVRNVLQVTHVESIFRQFATVAEAEAALGSDGARA